MFTMANEFEILRLLKPEPKRGIHDAPEPHIETYHCRHCDELCGADDKYRLCADCRKKDDEADEKRRIEFERAEEREAAGYELRREYSHWSQND